MKHGKIGQASNSSIHGRWHRESSTGFTSSLLLQMLFSCLCNWSFCFASLRRTWLEGTADYQPLSEDNAWINKSKGLLASKKWFRLPAVWGCQSQICCTVSEENICAASPKWCPRVSQTGHPQGWGMLLSLLALDAIQQSHCLGRIFLCRLGFLVETLRTSF